MLLLTNPIKRLKPTMDYTVLLTVVTVNPEPHLAYCLIWTSGNVIVQKFLSLLNESSVVTFLFLCHCSSE